MIVDPDFIWLHLPRTGGTSTADWFRALGRPGCEVDPNGDRMKHDNLCIRRARDGLELKGRPVVMNIRPLPDWLRSMQSWWLRSGGRPLPPERYLRGEFFSLRTGDWRRADWWLDYMDHRRVGRWLRTTHLEADWRAFLGEIGWTAPAHPVEQLNGGRLRGDHGGAEPDWSEAYRNNPAWAELEAGLYPRSS